VRSRINPSIEVVAGPTAAMAPESPRWSFEKWVLLSVVGIAVVLVVAVVAGGGKDQSVTAPKAASSPVVEQVGCQYGPYICDTAERLYDASNLANARFSNSEEVRASARSGVLYVNMKAMGVYDSEDQYEVTQELVRLWDERH